MPRKVIRFRKYRNRANYTVQRRVISLGTFQQSPADPQVWASETTLVQNPTDGDNIVNGGGNKTIKHIEVQLLRRPEATIEIQSGQIRRAFPAMIWMAVYVPEGTQPSLPFGNVSVQQAAVYEPAQFVLGSGVIPFGGETIDGAQGDLRQFMDSGNATRIRVPLSKKLMPGDRIVMLVSTLDAAYGDLTPKWNPCQLLVKYAIKFNYFVCSNTHLNIAATPLHFLLGLR